MLDKILAEINTVKSEVTGMKTELNDKIDKVESGLNNKIDKVESGLNDKIGKVESGLNDKIGRVESGLNNKLDKVEAGLNDKINKVDSGLNGKIDDLKREMRSEFKKVYQKLDDQHIENIHADEFLLGEIRTIRNSVSFINRKVSDNELEIDVIKQVYKKDISNNK